MTDDDLAGRHGCEPARDPLLQFGAVSLAKKIACGEVSARQAVEAHLSRIQQVDETLNALAVPRLDQALEAANRADAAQARGDDLGPLHGVPISVKECFDLAGTPSTMGLPSRQANVAVEDSLLVRRLRNAGAIIVGKGNVPQLMLSHECENPLFGRTNNPWDLRRTSGGSSGGEAALIAAKCTAAGLGTDLGGSLRVPAHFCGIHTVKPGDWRLARSGVIQNIRGQQAIQFQAGPMARRVEDLAVMLSILHGGDTTDVETGVAPVPLFRWEDVDLSGLGVGVCLDDATFSASPAIRDAVESAASALGNRGARLESLDLPIATFADIYVQLLAADGGQAVRSSLNNDQGDWRVRRLLRLAGLPVVARWLLAAGLDFTGPRSRRAFGKVGSSEFSQWLLATVCPQVRRGRFASTANGEASHRRGNLPHVCNARPKAWRRPRSGPRRLLLFPGQLAWRAIRSREH